MSAADRREPGTRHRGPPGGRHRRRDRAGGRSRILRGATYLRLTRPDRAASRYHAPAAPPIPRAAPFRQEEFVARAKRTDRTEARRRHRAEQAALAETRARRRDDRRRDDAQARPPRRPRRRRSRASWPRSAWRYRPLDLRDDLRSLPTGPHQLGLPGGDGHHGGHLRLVRARVQRRHGGHPGRTGDAGAPRAVVGTNAIPYFLGTMALQPPPAIGAFLIGFTAKRATWLGGLIYGIFVTVLAIIVLQTEAGRLLTGDQPTDALMRGHAAWSPVGAVAVRRRRRLVPAVPGPRRTRTAGSDRRQAAGPRQREAPSPPADTAPSRAGAVAATGIARPIRPPASPEEKGGQLSPRRRRPRDGSSGRTGVAAVGARRSGRQRSPSSSPLPPLLLPRGDPSPGHRVPGMPRQPRRRIPACPICRTPDGDSGPPTPAAASTSGTTSRATTFTTSPSRCRSPSTSSSA